jgi:hypothetical protein
MSDVALTLLLLFLLMFILFYFFGHVMSPFNNDGFKFKIQNVGLLP